MLHDAHSPAPVPDVLRRLALDYSVEVTSREGHRVESLADLLVPGTRVYITFLANTPFEDTVALAERAVAEGMRPVPHLAARAVPDLATLDRMIGRLADVGVADLLVIAGSLAHPVGEISETAQVLTSGSLERHGIHRVGVAGHPEGNKDIGDEGLAGALAEKNRLAAERDLDVYLVTQFTFAGEPVVEWEQRIRAAGNRLPVDVGLPGCSTPAKLLRFGLSCGIGPSLKVLRKQTGGVLRLATASEYHPDETVLALARSVAADPGSLVRSLHFFPFGALAGTAAWADGLRDGRFVLDEGGFGLQVTA